MSISYLQDKDVKKICSFFKFNYGTITVTKKEKIFQKYNLEFIDSLNCPSNATNSKECNPIILFDRKRDFFIPNIECFNTFQTNCSGDFVISVDDICYYVYEISKPYTISETNNLCLQRNNTEIDFSTKYVQLTFHYLLQIFYPEIKIEGLIFNFNVPFKYFSNILFLYSK